MLKPAATRKGLLSSPTTATAGLVAAVFFISTVTIRHASFAPEELVPSNQPSAVRPKDDKINPVTSESWTEEAKTLQKAQNIWVSMALCFSSNTRFHRKRNFPYKLAAKLSSQLWLNRTDVKTIIWVIYETKDKGSPDLDTYLEELEDMGNHIVEAVETKDMPCSLKSQLQRIFMPPVDLVSDNDIVVSSDVDNFVITRDIFDEVWQNQDKISILQYDNTLEFGNTFAMVFIAMRARLWRRLIKQTDPEVLVSAYSSIWNLDMTGYTWDWDQKIISRIILETGLCTAPAKNGIWKEVLLTPPVAATEKRNADRATCFHGLKKWEDCTKVKSRYKHPMRECCRWHFHPEDGEKQLERKFRQILVSPEKKRKKGPLGAESNRWRPR